MKVLLVQGANMEYLGFREPAIYGTTTAAELNDMLMERAMSLSIELEIRYTNVEGEAISAIYQAARQGFSAIVMNPAGFMHSGFALRDCLKAVPLPCIEVHMSNIDARALHSVTACASVGLISGFGIDSYLLALSVVGDVVRKSGHASAV